MSSQKSHQWSFVGKLSLAVSCGAALCWLTWSAQAQEDTKKRPLQINMRAKLDASAKVLEGLATEDKELIHEGTQVLTVVSRAEIWQVLKDAEYREHTQAFRSAIKRLDEAAQESKFASAQLEWLDATKKCFDCHNHIRSQKSDSNSK